MNHWVCGLALALVVAGTCGHDRASDTLDGRPAVSGTVERTLTKEEERRQRERKEWEAERKELKAWLKKQDEDNRQARKLIEELDRERIELLRRIREEKKQIQEMELNGAMLLGTVPIPSKPR